MDQNNASAEFLDDSLDRSNLSEISLNGMEPSPPSIHSHNKKSVAVSPMAENSAVSSNNTTTETETENSGDDSLNASELSDHLSEADKLPVKLSVCKIELEQANTDVAELLEQIESFRCENSRLRAQKCKWKREREKAREANKRLHEKVHELNNKFGKLQEQLLKKSEQENVCTNFVKPFFMKKIIIF